MLHSLPLPPTPPPLALWPLTAISLPLVVPSGLSGLGLLRVLCCPSPWVLHCVLLDTFIKSVSFKHSLGASCRIFLVHFWGKSSLLGGGGPQFIIRSFSLRSVLPPNHPSVTHLHSCNHTLSETVIWLPVVTDDSVAHSCVPSAALPHSLTS